MAFQSSITNYTNSSRSEKPTKPSLNEIIESLISTYQADWIKEFSSFIQKVVEERIHRKINTLSLFSGAGGLDIGFHEAGFSISTMIEIDSMCIETLKANSVDGQQFKDINILCCDIRDFVPNKLEKVDFVIGGPPCQTFSAAGRRAAGVIGTCDQRGSLFEEYVRIVDSTRPLGFLFENVYGIKGSEKGESWNKITEAFKSIGYNIHYRILSASDYGVPQRRERMFIVGTQDKNFRFPRPTHGPDSENQIPFFSASDALKSLRVENELNNFVLNGRYGYLLEQIPPGLNYSFFTEKMGHPNPVFAWRSKFSDFLYKADPDAPVRTLKAQGGQYTGPFHWENRPFTIDELKRLQTFPDNYIFPVSKLKSIKQIGNSVPPQIARIMALCVLDQIFEIDLGFDISTLSPKEELSFSREKRKLTELYEERAAAAIKNLIKENNKINELNKVYFAILTNGFGFEEVTKKESLFKVDLNLTQQRWKISLSTDHEKSMSPSFEIIIKPSDEQSWSMPTEEVVLQGEKLDGITFTSVWKAFEKELISQGIKADIVQLNGYYQYSPKIKSKMNIFVEHDEKWENVKKIVEEECTRQILSVNEIARKFDIPENSFFDFALFLRDLGYEIRNWNTNYQIPMDHYLIPYHFPTLTPVSVQLRKSLIG